MEQADPKLDIAFKAIEDAILPNLSMLIGNALQAATARPCPSDAEELRRIARQIGELTDLLASSIPQPVPAPQAVPDKMSA